MCVQDIMQQVVEYIQREFAVMKGAPVAALVFVAIGYAIAAWYYGRDLRFLERQVDEYKQRLGLAPKDQTAYSRLTHAELKRAIDEYVNRLRDFAERAKTEDQNAFLSELNQRSSGKSNDERKETWQRSVMAAQHRYLSRNAEFSRGYLTEGVLLRNETLRRLPKQGKEPMTALDPVYTLGDQIVETLIENGEKFGFKHSGREVTDNYTRVSGRERLVSWDEDEEPEPDAIRTAVREKLDKIYPKLAAIPPILKALVIR